MSAADTTAFDKDLLGTLTEEERAAMAESEHTPEELAALAEIAGDTPAAVKPGQQADVVDDDDDDANGDPAAATPAAAPAAAAALPEDATSAAAATPAEPAAAPATQQQVEEDDEGAPRQRYRAELPADYDAQMQAIKEQDAQAREKFKAGEIDIDERDRLIDEARDKREELLLQRARVETLNTANEQDAQYQWQATITNFTRATAKLTPEEGGVDYAKDEAKRKDWDLFVRHLANDEANANRPARWFLEEAHKRVLALHGLSGRAPSAAPAATPAAPPVDPKAAVKAAATQRSAADAAKAAAEASLSQVPGGEGKGDLGGDPYADIMSLEGQDFEDAIARMSPADREKFKGGK